MGIKDLFGLGDDNVVDDPDTRRDESLDAPLDAPLQLSPEAQEVAQCKADLESRGVELSGSCGAIKITNLFAWRSDGKYGLLWKTAGNRAALHADGSCLSGSETSEGGYATDYVIDRSTFYGYDILQDGGGLNGPQWGEPETDPAMVNRNRNNFRPAIDPKGYYKHMPDEPVEPEPKPDPKPDPATPTIDYSPLLVELLDEQARTTEAVNGLRKDVKDGLKSLNVLGGLGGLFKSKGATTAGRAKRKTKFKPFPRKPKPGGKGGKGGKGKPKFPFFHKKKR